MHNFGFRLSKSAKLLGVETDQLKKAITTKLKTANRDGRSGADEFTIELDKQQATGARDALAKGLYGTL